MQWKTIDTIIERIDIDDGTYRITSARDVDPLVASIGHVGLLNPPFLLEKEGIFHIVSGFRRVAACKKLKLEKIPARLISPDTSIQATATTAIAENVFQRTLNLVEVSRSLNLLDKCFKNSDQALGTTQSLGLPTNPSASKKIKRIDRLPQITQVGICDGIISLKIALELDRMDPVTAAILSQLFIDLHLSQSKQREIISHLQEVAIREDSSPAAVFEEQKLQSILIDQNLDRNLKTKHMRAYLKFRRYPHLADTENKFLQNAKKLHLGEHIQLNPPANFESGEYVFNIRFKNISELETRLKKIQNVLNNPHLKKILT